MQNKWFLNKVQQNQNQDFHHHVFLMQDFCLHSILPFSKSQPEIESTWPTTNYKGRVFWHMILHSCATLCVSFSSKSKAINVFPKHILKSKACDHSIQASKKLFCHENYLCNISWKFWSKSKAHGGTKSKNRYPSWL